MNLQLGSFIILAIVFVTVGFIGGALIALFFSDREKGGEQEVESSAPIKGREQEIAVLLRDPENGSLIMEMQGRSFSVSKELPDKTRAALLRVAQEWFVWLGGRIESPKSAAGKAVHPVSNVGSGEEDKSTEGAPQSARTVVKNKKDADKSIAGSLVDAVVISESPSKASSIVEQIDEILQDMLFRSPLANRKIRLAEDLKNGVVVWVDHKSFVGIDAVDEPEVSAILRQAVAEWERRAEHRR